MNLMKHSTAVWPHIFHLKEGGGCALQVNIDFLTSVVSYFSIQLKSH